MIISMKFVYPCQYCTNTVERNVLTERKFTCFDCKKKKRINRSAAVQAIKSIEVNKRRAGHDEFIKERNEKIYSLARQGTMTLREIGQSLTPKKSLSCVSRILILYERKHNMKFPRMNRSSVASKNIV